MNKSKLIALIMIVVLVVVFILSKGSVSVNMAAFDITAAKGFVFLAFTATGVVIGVLLK